MVISLDKKIVESFDRIRKIYLLEKFENLSENTEDILKNNIHKEDFLMNLKSTIELIIESGLETKIVNFDNLLDIKDLEDELNSTRSYLIELLKGDPDVENVKSFIIFDINTGTVRFGWNHSIFKKDIDLVMGLFTAVATFSKEAIDRQLKGLSVEGMEFKMIPFEKSTIAILFILNRNPSPLLIKRIELFKNKLEIEFGELFITKNYLDFTDDLDIIKKIYEIMVNIFKFDLQKLTAMNKNK